MKTLARHPESTKGKHHWNGATGDRHVAHESLGHQKAYYPKPDRKRTSLSAGKSDCLILRHVARNSVTAVSLFLSACGDGEARLFKRRRKQRRVGGGKGEKEKGGKHTIFFGVWRRNGKGKGPSGPEDLGSGLGQSSALPLVSRRVTVRFFCRCYSLLPASFLAAFRHRARGPHLRIYASALALYSAQ